METNYFGMDSFDRDTVYCCNAVSPQAATVTTKYLDLEGLKTYDRISMERDVAPDRIKVDGKTLTEMFKEIGVRLNSLENRQISVIPSAFVMGKLKRADLNLVFGK